MPRPSWSLFGRLVRRSAPDGDPAADADLLARFARDRDASAFELLVWRHGSLVLGVCKRVLGDEHLAEDAFQATFLILARKAGAVRSRNVAGWLHQVARRVAVRAAKKRVSTRETTLDHEPIRETSTVDSDWKPLLDAEVARLPERFRLPVLLCYLQDYTTDEAARALGVPRGTVLSRLATARQRLSARLTRRGVALPATLVGATVGSTPLVTATVRSAAAFAAGEAILSSSPTLLATEVLRMTAWKLPATLAAAMMLTVGVGSGIAWVQSGGGGPGDGKPVAQQKGKTEPEVAKGQSIVKKPEDEARKQARENLEKRIADLDKESDQLSQQLYATVARMRTQSLEEFQAIQQRYADQSKQLSDTQRELREVEFQLRNYKLNQETRTAQIERDAASGMSVHLDLNTRDGLRLQAYYKQQIDAELKLKDLKANGFDQSGKAAVAQTKLLEGLERDIRELEGKIRTVNAREQHEAFQKKIKDVEMKRDFLKEHMKSVEYRLGEDLKLGISIGTLTSEAQAIKDKIVKIDFQIKEAQDAKSRLEFPYPTLGPRDRIDEVLAEIALLRKDLAEVKQAVRK